MNYKVLARKWRPCRFEDLVGQEHIVKMLVNALTQQRLHHAYLFTGTRGVGKTTIARILARCLNCESGVTASPCGQCYACQAIDHGQFLDLYEIDAASRTKVEDTRELLDNVMYPPTKGRYKVYLIDEVHMLSNHSFNALLKTLEEPPAHVVFILATTDPKRLPITILSRCLQFHLKRIQPESIAKHLQQICSAEKIIFESPALFKLAKAADGSLRDALSLLDQAIAYGKGNINQQDVLTMLGSTAQEDLLPIIEALATRDGKQLFHLVALLAERAPDFQQVLEELISLFHRIAISQLIPNTKEQDESFSSLLPLFTPEDIQLYYQIALLGRRDLAYAPSQQQGFEMTMLRMLAFQPNLNQNETQSTNHLPIQPAEIKPAIKEAPVLEKNVNVTPMTDSTVNHHLPEWRDLLPKLELSGMAYALASNCTLKQMMDHKIELALSASHEPMMNAKLKERIAEALSRHLQKPIQLDISITTEELSTPTKLQQHEKEQRLATAKKNISEDPAIKKLIDMYDATVEVSILG